MLQETDDLTALRTEAPRAKPTKRRRSDYTKTPVRLLTLLSGGKKLLFAVHELKSAIANYVIVPEGNGSDESTLVASDARATRAEIVRIVVINGKGRIPCSREEYQFLPELTKSLPKSPGGQLVTCDYYERRKVP